jgi:hypothetical protein
MLIKCAFVGHKKLYYLIMSTKSQACLRFEDVLLSIAHAGNCMYVCICKVKDSNPETGLCGLEESGRLRLPDF